MFEVAIIGSGPAGISAALTLNARNVNFIMFGNTIVSNKVKLAEKIINYPGFPQISGQELHDIFVNQLLANDINIENKTVTGIYDMGDRYSILCGQDEYEAKNIILTTGVETVKAISGELEFLGRGVSYCATCDGFLYKDKKIAVICTDKSLEHEIEFLAKTASEVVLFPIYKDCSIKADNITVIREMPLRIVGSLKADGLIVSGGQIDCDGVFVLKNSISPSALISGLETQNGHIKVDRMCKTNLHNVYAAGDVTGRPYQFTKAVGEGNVAAHSIIE